jgi:hypothetical protein
MFVAMSASTAEAAELTCSTSTTLEELVTCVRDHMPRGSSGVFAVPSATQIDAWRSVIRAMMGGACSATLPSSLSPLLQRRLVRDSENGRRYCVLIEVADRNGDNIVDRGFGTFIVDAAAERELSHQAPHPISDRGTELQAVTVFKETRSRSFLMAGAHRDASFTESDCQSSSRLSDVAHNVANLFHEAHLALMAHYGSGPWWAIQWHGMAEDTCAAVDVHLSHGVGVPPAEGDKLLALRRSLLASHPGWRVGVPGAGVCSLNATTNVQGRLLNGVSATRVCGTRATTYSGRLTHIEQDPAFRDPESWISAIRTTWPR